MSKAALVCQIMAHLLFSWGNAR